MAERKNFDAGLVRIGNLLTAKRKALGPLYKTRENLLNSEALNFSVVETGYHLVT